MCYAMSCIFSRCILLHFMREKKKKKTVIVKISSPKNMSANGRPTDYWQITNRPLTANQQATNSFPRRKFVVKTCSKHDPEMIIIMINITFLPIDGKRISFQDVYRKLMKCVVDISFVKFVTNRTINVIRHEGDLIQTSEIQGESSFGSLSIVSLNFTYKSPNNA